MPFEDEMEPKGDVSAFEEFGTKSDKIVSRVGVFPGAPGICGWFNGKNTPHIKFPLL